MARTTLDDAAAFVTEHSGIVVLVMLALTAGMAVGATQLDTGSSAGGSDGFADTTPAAKADYIDERYGTGDDRDVAHAVVYVRDEGGNALSKASLLATLRYQQTVAERAAVADAAAGEAHGWSVATVVARHLADDPDAGIAAQREALAAASEAEVEAAVRERLGGDSRAIRLLPTEYEPGSASAESHRLLFRFEATDGGGPPSAATAALYEAAGSVEEPRVFTLGEHARMAANEQLNRNTLELIVPVALALVFLVLAFAYRDPVDVLVGMTGVVVSIVWMFGILGFLGVAAGVTMIIGPVLVAGLSIDYGFHVFTRYREQRDADEPVRPPMRRALRSVAVALGLVTLTTGIGFLSNVVNPVADIRALGVGITLGVVSALVVFTTLVPALKVLVDGLLERFGLDRRARPLGDGAWLRPLLASGVTLARRAAPVVVLVAAVAGAGGAAAWTALDEKPFDRQTEPTAEWKTDLPGPMAWEDSDYSLNQLYVQQAYRSVADDDGDRLQLLVEGDVTDPGTLAQVQDGVGAVRSTLDAPGRADVVSPLTVMRSVAAEDTDFAETFRAADGDGDGVPDRNLAAVYDHLYRVAPERAARVVERSDGEYRSLRVVGPADGGGRLAERADRQRDAAAAIEDGSADLDATAVSGATVRQSGIEAVTDGILRVMGLALAAVFLVYVLVTWRVHGSASLGAVTAAPIPLVVGLVVGGMYALDVPLTLLTALLMSLVVGLGIDYNVHLGDRFAQELRAGKSPDEALETAVVGTGGALLGSALTTSVAFVSMSLHPSPQLQNFATLVVLALATALVVSLLVLPSALALWARHARAGSLRAGHDGRTSVSDD